MYALMTLGVLATVAVSVLTAITYLKSRRMSQAKDRIVKYFLGNTSKIASYERIRLDLNSGYTDQFLESLVDQFPNELRRALLRDESNNLNKKGLAKISTKDIIVETFRGEGRLLTDETGITVVRESNDGHPA